MPPPPPDPSHPVKSCAPNTSAPLHRLSPHPTADHASTNPAISDPVDSVDPAAPSAPSAPASAHPPLPQPSNPTPPHSAPVDAPVDRILLPPLPASAPRKRSRMNPYIAPIPDTAFFPTSSNPLHLHPHPPPHPLPHFSIQPAHNAYHPHPHHIHPVDQHHSALFITHSFPTSMDPRSPIDLATLQHHQPQQQHYSMHPTNYDSFQSHQHHHHQQQQQQQPHLPPFTAGFNSSSLHPSITISQLASMSTAQPHHHHQFNFDQPHHPHHPHHQTNINSTTNNNSNTNDNSNLNSNLVSKSYLHHQQFPSASSATVHLSNILSLPHHPSHSNSNLYHSFNSPPQQPQLTHSVPSKPTQLPDTQQQQQPQQQSQQQKTQQQCQFDVSNPWLATDTPVSSNDNFIQQQQNNYVNWLSDSSSTFDGATQSFVQNNTNSAPAQSAGTILIESHGQQPQLHPQQQHVHQPKQISAHQHQQPQHNTQHEVYKTDQPVKFHQFNSNNEQQNHLQPHDDMNQLHLQPILSNVVAHPVSLVPLHSELIVPDNVDSTRNRKRRMTMNKLHDDKKDANEDEDEEEDINDDEEDERHDQVCEIKCSRVGYKPTNKRGRVGNLNTEEEQKENERVSKMQKTNISSTRKVKQPKISTGDDSDLHIRPLDYHRTHQHYKVDSRIGNSDVEHIEAAKRRNAHAEGHVTADGDLGETSATSLRREVISTAAIRHDDVGLSNLPNQGSGSRGMNIVNHDLATTNNNLNGSSQARRAGLDSANNSKNIGSHNNSGNRSGVGGNTTSNNHNHSHGHLNQSRGRAVRRRDDRNGHLVYKLGEGLDANEEFPNGRYKILNELGEGTFGKVVECWDRLELRRVAIKVVRSINKYRQAARLEIDILLHLNLNDANGVFHCVKLYSWFEYHSHVCMVFEKLGPSLYDQLRRNHFRPFPLEQVRDYAFQLLESVNFVHSLTLIHTDLKPENILVASTEDHSANAGNNKSSNGVINATTAGTTTNHRVEALVATTNVSTEGGDGINSISDKNNSIINHTGATTVASKISKGGLDGWNGNAIKLIDFGSATYEAHHHSALISTRHYRAPEVILGLGWTYPCDLWSIGCILVELYTGQALFQTHENLEHLAMMSHVLGPIPESMIRRTVGQGQKYFRNKGGRRSLNWPSGATSKSSIHSVRNVQSLDRLIPREIGHDEFRDLVKKLLAFEPHTRYTTREALRHPFFRNMGRDEGNALWSPRSETVTALGWGEQHNTNNKANANGNGNSRSRRHKDSDGDGAKSGGGASSGEAKTAALEGTKDRTHVSVCKVEIEVRTGDMTEADIRVKDEEHTRLYAGDDELDEDEDEDEDEEDVRQVKVDAHRHHRKTQLTQKQKQKQEGAVRSASVKEEIPFCAFPVGKGRDGGRMTQQVW